jgi:hypothetical protein
VGFEPTIPVFERATTEISEIIIYPDKYFERYIIFGENVAKVSEKFAASISGKSVSRTGM